MDIEQPRESFHPHDTMTKNFAGSAGATALWVACGSGHASMAQFLLARGARVDAADDAQMTPLHAACAAGHDEVARLLLDNGASINSLADGGTPLMSACAAGHAECVRVLLKAGADPFKEFGVAYTRRHHTQGMRWTDNAYECAFNNTAIVRWLEFFGKRLSIQHQGSLSITASSTCRARLRQAPIS